MYNNPKVSIIIPIYNSEKYIKKCLDSLCNQTLKDIEIICINDGSTDLSIKIIQEFIHIDNRITLINQSNLGVSAARKNGILHASAEYIGFIDSDDYVENNYFENLFKIAISEDADIVVTGEINEFNEKINIKRTLFKYDYKMNLTDLERCKLFVLQTGLCNKIYKKTLATKALSYYDNNRNDGEDAQYLLFLFLFAKKITYSNTARYYYRINDNSISRRNITINDIFNIFYMYNNTYIKLNFIQNKGIYKNYLLKRRNMHIYKKLCLLPNLQQRITFLLRTGSLNLLFTCFIRFSVKNLLPQKLANYIHKVYNNIVLSKKI